MGWRFVRPGVVFARRGQPTTTEEVPVGSRDSGGAPCATTEYCNGSGAGGGVVGALFFDGIWDTTEGSKTDST